MAKANGLGVWNSVKTSCNLVWLGCLSALGALGALRAGWALAPHSLGCSLPLSALNSLNLNTIHPQALALISPFVRPPFRVGLDVELLLVSGYAWTPRSWTTVEVARLGLVS